MANPTETGPKNIGPLTGMQIKENLSHLRYPTVEYAPEGLIGSYPDFLFWSEAVLRQAREGKHIATSLNKVGENRLDLMEYHELGLVQRETRTKLEGINPLNLRLVDWELSYSEYNGNLARVGNSGYVLDDSEHPYVYIFHTQRREIAVSTDAIEKILVAADQGQKPENLSEDTFVKVNPRLAGKRVTLIMFQASKEEGTTSPYIRDAVVIDPDTHELVPRKVLRPLSSAKWDKTPHRRLSILEEYPYGFPPHGDNNPALVDGKMQW